MAVATPFDEHVVARLLDFFGEGTQWHRRLWTVGSVVALRECVAVHEEVTEYKGARSGARHAAKRACCGDPGIGSGTVRGLLAKLLEKDMAHDSLELRMLRQISEAAEPGYLTRWVSALRTAHAYGEEHTARRIAGFLLDGGNSPAYLHRWWTAWARRDPTVFTLADLLEKLESDGVMADSAFDVVVLARNLPYVNQAPGGYMTRAALAAWAPTVGLLASVVGAADVSGAIRMNITARDPGAAVEMAGDQVEAFASRLALTPGSGARRVDLKGRALVVGIKKPIPLRRRRRVELGSLKANDRLYAEGTDRALESAIELLAHLDSSAPGAAASAGWAAIESLLKGTGEDARAADAATRMARLVTASFPRAELTRLAREIANGPGKSPLAAQLRPMNNRARAGLLAPMVKGGYTSTTADASSLAAYRRMHELLNAPETVLKAVQAYAEDTFLRLNRLRNVVMHAGRTDAVGLRATLRAAAPIAGAGMDRIAHGTFVLNMSPLDVVAMAERRLRVVKQLPAGEIGTLLDAE